MSVENIFSDLNRMIDQIGKDKGIDRQIIVDAITQGMLMAARKKYGTYREIEAQFNDETGEVELYEFKEVVLKENFVDEEVEIPLEEGRELDPDCQVGDYIGSKLDSSDLGRIAVQTARQIITQKVRDAEREIIFQEFDQRKGEIASGIVRRVERGTIVVDLGRTEAYLPHREQIPGEVYKQGDRIQGYLTDVRQTNRGPQIIMSRANEQYMVKLFEMEVPEIHDGIVEIVSAAREPGSRAKIAVISKDSAVDPVGACVGMKGSRVQNIVQELQGEKIDIVIWEEDITRFVCNALAPAEVSKVFVDEENQEMEVVVPDSQLSLAIGRKGQNVRLAAKLTGWHVDIISETNVAAKTAEAVFNLMLIPGMSETMAQNIYQSGFMSFKDLSQSESASVMTIPGYDDPEKAEKLIQQAKDLVEEYEKEGKEVPTIESSMGASATATTSASTSGGAKEQADQRLKEELAQLENSENTDGSDESVEVAAEESTGDSAQEEELEESKNKEQDEK